MTITTHITNSYLDDLFDFLKIVERDVHFVYRAPEGAPTLSVGYALIVEIGGQWGIRTGYEADLINSNIFLTGEELSILQDYLVQAAAALNGDPNATNPFYPADQNINPLGWEISDTQSRNLFEYALPTYEKKVDDFLAKYSISGLDARNSQERIALVSLGWNQKDGSTALLGKKLGTALQYGDRAEAWFEIRYNSNLNKIHASRRYKEANLFGLYNESPTEDDYKSAYRMLTRHRQTVLVYEAKYNPFNAGVGLIQEELGQAYYNLTAQYGQGKNFSALDVYVGEDQSSIYYKGTDADVLTGSDQSDLIFGESGNDLLDGGAGDDVLYGGSGADVYYYRPGDGNDIIIDDEGAAGTNSQGVIVYDPDGQGLVLGIATRKAQADGSYLGSWQGLQSSGLNIAYDWSGTPGEDLSISIAGQGTITVKAYRPGDLGIELIDLPADPATDLPAPEVWDGSQIRNGTSNSDRAGTSDFQDFNGDGLNDLGAIYGTAAAELLHGQAGDDDIYAGAGGDRVYGDADDDYLDASGVGVTVYLDGGTGRDILIGGMGRDHLVGGPDDSSDTADALQGGAGNDYLEGGGGDDFLAGGAGRDVLIGGTGNDVIWGAATLVGRPDRLWQVVGWPDPNNEYNTISYEEFDGFLFADDGAGDVIDGGPGEDILVGSSGDDVIYGGTENDSLNGYGGKDLLVGGDGHDALTGGRDADVLIGGSGNDWLYGDYIDSSRATDGDDILDGGAGDDHLLGGGGDDTLYGGDDADWLQGGDGNGDDGDDALYGGAGDDVLFGEDGNDYLNGGDDNDELIGGAGADVLEGGAGDDLLWIDALDRIITGTGIDNVYKESEVTNGMGEFTLPGNEFQIYQSAGAGSTQALSIVFSATDQVHIHGGFLDEGQSYIFGGTSYSQRELMQFAPALNINGDARSNIIYGGNNDDRIFGYAGAAGSLDEGDELYGQGGNDVLAGGLGDDLLDGGAGNDVFLWNIGDGNDLIIDPSGVDRVVFGSGISVSNLSIGTYVGADGHDYLRIDHAASNSSLSIQDGSQGIVEEFLFVDDSFFNFAQFMWQFGVPVNLVGTGNADTLIGSDGDDTLDGGGGNDHLAGGNGNDTLDGGPGDDTLWGGSDGDTYLYERGDGRDTIFDEEYTFSANDVLRFGAGISPADAILTRDRTNLYISLNSVGDQLTIENWFFGEYWLDETGYRIESIEFADGSVWTPADVDSLIVVPSATNTNDFLYGSSRDDVVVGLAGNDQLWGQGGADTLDGGTGNDLLYGGAGGDRYWFARGFGQDTILDYEPILGNIDVIEFAADIAPSDVIVTRGVSDLYLQIAGTSDRITLYNYWFNRDEIVGQDGYFYRIEEVRFSDGTVWDPGMQIVVSNGTANGDQLFGGSQDDLLNGLAGRDGLIGGPGNDVIVGGPGTDGQADGGDGSDVYLINPGDTPVRPGIWDREYIWDDSSTVGDVDTLSFGGGIRPEDIDAYLYFQDYGGGESYSELMLQIHSTGETIWSGWTHTKYWGIDAELYTFDYRIEQIQFLGSDNDRIFDLAGLVAARFDELRAASESSPIALFTTEALAQFDITDQVEFAGGSYAINYAFTGDVFTAPSGNTPPVLSTPLTDQSATEDSPFSFTVPAGSFTDSDVGDTLTYTATQSDGSALPVWLAFDAGTQTFTGTPDNSNVGSLDVKVTATDSQGASVSDVFSLTVTNTNDVPALASALADQSATEDSPFTFTVPAGSFTDPDVGDVLTYSATLSDGSALPVWLAFNAATQTFSGTPTNGDVGSLLLRVTATDGSGASVSDDFSLNVINTNDTPILANALADQSALEGTAFSFTIPANAFSDPDVGDTLTYSATQTDGSPLPAWLTFDAETNTISGTPGNGDVGSLSILVTATDSTGSSASDEIILTISGIAATNQAPIVASPVADQVALEDSPFTFTVPTGSFTDPDAGDTLTYSATLSDGSTLPSWLAFDAATQTFSGTPTNAEVGSLSVRVTATDGSGASVSDDFSLNVLNTNDTPVLANVLADQSALEGTAFSVTVPANAFSDPDVSDTLTYSATQSDGSALPTWLSFDAGTRTFSGTPTNGDVGNLSLRVTATDTSGASASDDFSLNVLAGGGSTIIGTEDNDALVGTPGADYIDGGEGSDDIFGGDGNDTIVGGPGADYLYGEGGDDTFLITGTDSAVDLINGGAGVDRILGGAGDDTFRFDTFAGQDTVELIDGGAGTNTIAGSQWDDVLDFRNTTLLNIAYIDAGDWTDTIYGTSGNDTIYGGADHDYLYGEGGDDLLDGGDGQDEVYGGEGNDTIIGGLGTDYLYGEGGDDTFIIEGDDPTATDIIDGGTGYDRILGGAGDDTLRFNNFSAANNIELIDGGAGTNVIALGPWGNDLDFRNITLLNIAYIDATIDPDQAVIHGSQGDDTIVAGPGSDYLFGEGGDDTLIGGAGRDELYGGDGNDTLIGGTKDDYLYGEGGDDTFIIEGTDVEADLVNGGAGLDQLLGGSGDDTFRFNYFMGEDTVELIDGQGGTNVIAGGQWNDILDFRNTTLLNIAYIDGGDGPDDIYGSQGADTIKGGLGHDHLYGEGGDDTFLIEGTDIETDLVNGGAGFDRILGGDGDDTFRFDYFSGEDSVELIDGGAGTNVIAGSQWGDTLDFRNTTLLNIAYIDGGAGPDLIYGSQTNDIMKGGLGDDYLYGEGGDDTFIIEGTDSASDLVNGGAGYDRVLGGSGDDTFRFEYFSGDDTVELIDGGAGTNVIAGSQLGDTLDFRNTTLLNIAYIDGGDGPDDIYGSQGNDDLRGGNGGDYLYGEAGDDILAGGKGADELRGGLGNDTYIYNKADGNDRIFENDATAGNTDTVQFSTDASQLIFSQSGSDLKVKYAGQSGTVTIDNWYSGTNYQTEVFQASDGSTLTNTQVSQLIQAMAQFSASHGGITWEQAVQQDPTEVNQIITAYWQPA